VPGIDLPPQLAWITPRDTLLLRICRAKYAAAEPYFGSSAAYRFDDPTKSYGTLYCAPDYATCFFETLVRDGSFDAPTGSYRVPLAEYKQRRLTLLLADVSRMKLVDLYGEGIKKMGLNSASGLGDYAGTQALSKALHDHSDEPHGIVYRSKFGPPDKAAIVLFDRAQPLVRLFPGRRPVALTKLREPFDALTQVDRIALV
jgi:hypothetical protein